MNGTELLTWIVENNGVVIGVLGFVAYQTWTVATKFTTLTDRLDGVEKEVKLLDDRGTKGGLSKAREYDKTISKLERDHEVLAKEIRIELLNIKEILQELKSR